MEEYKKRLRKLKKFETERLLLRSFQKSDIPDLYEYASDEKTTKFMPWDAHKDLEESAKIYETLFENKIGTYAIVLKSERKCIGSFEVMLDSNNHMATFGYVLNRKYWNQGYMTEVLDNFIDICFFVIGLNRVEATHSIGNEGSGKVMCKCGMRFEGISRQRTYIRGKFYDQARFGLTKKERRRKYFNG